MPMILWIWAIVMVSIGDGWGGNKRWVDRSGGILHRQTASIEWRVHVVLVDICRRRWRLRARRTQRAQVNVWRGRERRTAATSTAATVTTVTTVAARRRFYWRCTVRVRSVFRCGVVVRWFCDGGVCCGGGAHWCTCRRSFVAHYWRQWLAWKNLIRDRCSCW